MSSNDILGGYSANKGRLRKAFPAKPISNPGKPDPPSTAPAASPEPQGDGLIVGLIKIPGITQGKVLDDPFWFQCPPIDEMPRDITWQWSDYNTIGDGMHSTPAGPGLDTYQFTTLFVDDDIHHRFALYRNRHVLSMVRQLEALGNKMSPFQLQYGQPALWGVWDVVTAVTFRGMRISEHGGEDDARYVTLSFTEFADAPRLTAVHPPAHPLKKAGKHKGGSTTPNAKVLARLNSAALGSAVHTLALISKRYYGSSANWTVIAKASGLKNTGPNTDLPSTVGKHKPPATIVVPALPRK